MNKKLLIVAIGAIVLFLSLWLFPSEASFAFQQSEVTAREWVETKSPTYNKSGLDLTLVRKENKGGIYCHLCYEFTYSFNVPGGTQDTIVVRMEDGYIVSAVTDNSLNEIKNP